MSDTHSEPAANKAGSGIIRVTLTPEQRELLNPILDAARIESGLEGVLCTICRSYNPAAGRTTLELQCLNVNRPLARKVLKLIRSK